MSAALRDAPLARHGEKLAAAREVVARALREELRARDVMTQPATVRRYLALHFANYEYEAFVVLFLDAQNGLIGAEELFRGTLTQTSVYPREIAKASLRNNAAAVILAHNHPSGAAEPSLQDQALTRTLSETLALLDVKVLDHLVIAGSRSVSFAERGLL
jgi:DNA repair protein RadC